MHDNFTAFTQLADQATENLRPVLEKLGVSIVTSSVESDGYDHQLVLYVNTTEHAKLPTRDAETGLSVHYSEVASF